MAHKYSLLGENFNSIIGDFGFLEFCYCVWINYYYSDDIYWIPPSMGLPSTS